MRLIKTDLIDNNYIEEYQLDRLCPLLQSRFSNRRGALICLITAEITGDMLQEAGFRSGRSEKFTFTPGAYREAFPGMDEFLEYFDREEINLWVLRVRTPSGREGFIAGHADSDRIRLFFPADAPLDMTGLLDLAEAESYRFSRYPELTDSLSAVFSVNRENAACMIKKIEKDSSLLSELSRCVSDGRTYAWPDSPVRAPDCMTDARSLVIAYRCTVPAAYEALYWLRSSENFGKTPDDYFGDRKAPADLFADS